MLLCETHRSFCLPAADRVKDIARRMELWYLLTMTILGAIDGIGSLGGKTVRAGEVSEENGMEQQQRAGEDEWVKRSQKLNRAQQCGWKHAAVSRNRNKYHSLGEKLREHKTASIYSERQIQRNTPIPFPQKKPFMEYPVTSRAGSYWLRCCRAVRSRGKEAGSCGPLSITRRGRCLRWLYVRDCS